jgi:polyisoprenoid-binding protein YceI
MTTITSLPLRSGTWSIDPSHTSVEFTVRHLGLAKVRGRFHGVDASVVVGDDLSTSTVDAEIDLGTVDTGNPDRDTHLRSTDFFNVEANPKMTFSSTRIDQVGETYRLVGDLSLNGVTKPVELDVEFFGTSVFPMDQSTRAGFTASGQLSRKDYGIEFNVALGGDKYMISDKVNIDLDVQLVAPTS